MLLCLTVINKLSQRARIALVHLNKIYCIVKIGGSTSATLFYNDEGELEVYIGNHDDIEIEVNNLANKGYKVDDKILFYARESKQLPRPDIPEGIKHYDIEEVMQGDKLIACIVRSIHESHGKLMPNAITFAVDPGLIDNENNYAKAVRWITQRANAFSHILESEGMTKNPDFILNSYIYALENPDRLERFMKDDRGKQTVTATML